MKPLCFLDGAFANIGSIVRDCDELSTTPSEFRLLATRYSLLATLVAASPRYGVWTSISG